MAEGIDFSGSRPNPINVINGGKTFIARYFGPGGDWKHATPSEIAAAHAVGLEVVANAEGATMDPLSGRSMGVSHARSALQAATACGMPADRPIYFSIDFDMTTAQRSAVGLYMTGCADVLGWPRVGIYGGKRTIDWARDDGYASWFWQTYAWSGGLWSSGSHLQQYKNNVTFVGAQVDLDRSMTVDFGQWPHGTETFGTVPDHAPPVVTSGPWDYTDVIQGQANDYGSLAFSTTQWASWLDGLRNN